MVPPAASWHAANSCARAAGGVTANNRASVKVLRILVTHSSEAEPSNDALLFERDAEGLMIDDDCPGRCDVSDCTHNVSGVSTVLQQVFEKPLILRGGRGFVSDHGPRPIRAGDADEQQLPNRVYFGATSFIAAATVRVNAGD